MLGKMLNIGFLYMNTLYVFNSLTQTCARVMRRRSFTRFNISSLHLLIYKLRGF